MDGLIRVLNVNAAMTCLAFLAIAFKALGEVYERSIQVLLQQRVVTGSKWFRRFHRSCSALKFQVAGLYFVDSPMSLTMGSFVIQNVANMLILGKSVASELSYRLSLFQQQNERKSCNPI